MLRPPVQFSFLTLLLSEYWVLTAADLIISVLLWPVGSSKKKKHTSKEQEGNYAHAEAMQLWYNHQQIMQRQTLYIAQAHSVYFY